MVSDTFIEELRLQCERNIQVKERLDNKTNNIITISGMIATLFMGFGVFLLEHVDYMKYPNIVLYASIVLMAEVVLTAITVICSVYVYNLKTYTHPINYGTIYKISNGKPDEIIEQFKNASDDEIKDAFVINYMESIKSYEEQNNEKTNDISVAQVTLFLSICMIPIFSYFVILPKFYP